jgi:putative transposase
MPRRPRVCPAGYCFHVLNRAVARLPLFEEPEDFQAFEQVLQEAHQREPLPILAYCLMSDHWHFVVRPQTDSQVTNFFRWLTHTHTMRWHAHYHTEGSGHLYQGRFKAFPIAEDEHLLAVLRYVERNPLRAALCEHSADWKYGSAWRLKHGDAQSRRLLSVWPIPRPRQWRSFVDKPQTQAEVDAIRNSVNRGTPYGNQDWSTQSAARLQLQHTLRSRGRPKKQQ